MRKWIFSGLFALALTTGASANQSKVLCRGFAPENNMKIPVGSTFDGKLTGISKEQFNFVLDRIERLYTKEIAALGAKFSVERKWEDSTVNAYASQDGNTWTISMFGGLARYKGMTEDGFAAVACHEVGHHLGGAPRFSDDDWATVEGQSDYYATLKCMRRYTEFDDNDKITSNLPIDPLPNRQCEEQWANRQEHLICKRLSAAGLVLGATLQTLGGEKQVKFETPDPSVVKQTAGGHPRAQCRLDTYFQGGLCTVPYSDPVHGNDPKKGTCYDPAATPRGLRPLCWYKP